MMENCLRPDKSSDVAGKCPVCKEDVEGRRGLQAPRPDKSGHYETPHLYTLLEVSTLQIF